MTLTAKQSSNKAKYEAASTAEIIDIIRTAMGAGCIRPCHVYDAVDELICRIKALENRPKRNCDVGTADEQYARWRRFCDSQKCCNNQCPVYKLADVCGSKDGCNLIWAQMPYAPKEGGAK